MVVVKLRDVFRFFFSRRLSVEIWSFSGVGRKVSPKVFVIERNDASWSCALWDARLVGQTRARGTTRPSHAARMGVLKGGAERAHHRPTAKSVERRESWRHVRRETACGMGTVVRRTPTLGCVSSTTEADFSKMTLPTARGDGGAVCKRR